MWFKIFKKKSLDTGEKIDSGDFHREGPPTRKEKHEAILNYIKEHGPGKQTGKVVREMQLASSSKDLLLIPMKQKNYMGKVKKLFRAAQREEME